MKKTTKKKINKVMSKRGGDLERDIIEAWKLYLNNKQYKPLNRIQAKEALKEKKRRDKKITMTVGEFEDKLEEARVDSYDW